MIGIYFITGVITGMLFRATKTWARLGIWAAFMVAVLVVLKHGGL